MMCLLPVSIHQNLVSFAGCQLEEIGLSPKRIKGTGMHYVTRDSTSNSFRAKNNKRKIQGPPRRTLVEAAEDADCELLRRGYYPVNFPSKLEHSV